VLGEDVEDELRPVDDPGLESVLERALLGRAQFLVDEQHLRRRIGVCLLKLPELALSDEGTRIGTSAVLYELGHGGHARRARELTELRELGFRADTFGEHADDEPALRLRPWCGIGLARGHAGIMPR
jgi:hypothetical protein